MCIGLPLEIRTAATNFVKKTIVEELKAKEDNLSPTTLSEIKRIRYNFFSFELKDNMSNVTLLDAAFKKTEQRLFNLRKP